MSDLNRRCSKCGGTANVEDSVYIHRFPKPGKTNVLRARCWAKFCWPEQDWLSIVDLMNIFTSHKVLCGRHFQTTCFTDSSNRRLSKFSIPGEAEYSLQLITELRKEMFNKETLSPLNPLQDRPVITPDDNDDDKPNELIFAETLSEPDETNLTTERCRACLEVSDNQTSVMEEIVKTGFEELTGIIINPQDKHPQTVCQECLKKFQQFLEFRKTVLNNNRFLEEALHETKDTKMNKFPLNSEGCDENMEVDKEESNLSEGDNDTTDTFNMIVTDSKKRKVKLNKSSVKPRAFIEIDPQVIKVIKLSSEEQIRNHEAEATKASYTSMPHKCHICYKGFNFERKLLCHMKNCHKANSKYECDICHRTLSSAATYRLHLARHSTRYECRRCSHSFVDKMAAIAHLRRDHQGMRIDVACKLCHKTFRHRSTLNGHMRSEHDPSSRSECDVCHKVFRTKDSLEDHLLIHTGEKKFSCDVCGKNFRLKAESLAHLRRHDPARSHYCAKCDVMFKCQSALKRHMAHSVVHGNLKRHPCGECGRSFSTVGGLKAHARLHDRGPAVPCSRCAAAVPAAALRNHMRRHHHTNHRNYVCHHCAQRFSSMSSLNRHILIHLGLKPHACAHCDASFTQKSTLSTHVKLVHLKLKRTKIKPL